MSHETTIKANLNETTPLSAARPSSAKSGKLMKIDPVYLLLFVALIAIFAWQIKRFG